MCQIWSISCKDCWSFITIQVKTVPTLIWIGMDVPLIFEFGVEWIWFQLYGVGWKWGWKSAPWRPLPTSFQNEFQLASLIKEKLRFSVLSHYPILPHLPLCALLKWFCVPPKKKRRHRLRAETIPSLSFFINNFGTTADIDMKLRRTSWASFWRSYSDVTCFFCKLSVFRFLQFCDVTSLEL